MSGNPSRIFWFILIYKAQSEVQSMFLIYRSKLQFWKLSKTFSVCCQTTEETIWERCHLVGITSFHDFFSPHFLSIMIYKCVARFSIADVQAKLSRLFTLKQDKKKNMQWEHVLRYLLMREVREECGLAGLSWLQAYHDLNKHSVQPRWAEKHPRTAEAHVRLALAHQIHLIT